MVMICGGGRVEYASIDIWLSDYGRVAGAKGKIGQINDEAIRTRAHHW